MRFASTTYDIVARPFLVVIRFLARIGKEILVTVIGASLYSLLKVSLAVRRPYIFSRGHGY